MGERGPADAAIHSSPGDLLESGLGFYALTFTDIVRSTEHRANHGDGRADAVHAEVDVLTREVMEHFHGVVIKSLGDGLLAVFRTPTDAVCAGVALQQRLARRNRVAAVPVQVRVGISVGEVDVAQGDVHGYAVNEAARLCAAAEDGGVLVTELTSSLSRRANVEFGDVREVTVTPSVAPARALPVLVPVEELALVPLAEPLTFSRRAGRFVGRGDELTTLSDAFERARSGVMQVVVLSGEPGLGKTTLLGELARRVSVGPGVVLYGRCDERVAAPYQPFAEAFSHFVAHCPQPELKELLGENAEELVRLVPSLGRRLDLGGASAARDLEFERWRLHEAVGSALRTLSRFEPVLLIVDDLHWAGTSTIDLLNRILGDTVHQRLMVVLALRAWDPKTDPEVERLLADRHRLAADVCDIALAGLEREDVATLAATFKDAKVAHAQSGELWALTAGNPLFVAQLLRSTRADEAVPTRVPKDVVEVIQRQLDRLREPTRELLRASSLVGLRFEVHVSAEAAAMSTGDVLDCLEEAAHAGFVRALDGSPLRYEFTHAVERQALDDQFSAARRQHVHARIAASLESAPGVEPEDRHRRLTFHWSEAGEFADVGCGVAAGLEAIAYAVSHLALSDAYELLARVQTLAERSPDARRDAEIAVRRAEVTGIGAHPEARAHQLRAVEAARGLGDAALLGRAALSHSRGYFTSWGHHDAERIEALEAALVLCEPEHSDTRALLLSRLANEITFDDADHRRFDLAEEALRLARECHDSEVLASVLSHRQYVLAAPEHLSTRLFEGHEMEALAVATGNPLLEVHACRLLCAAFTENADVEQLDRRLARLDELNEQLELASLRWEYASVCASRAILAGELKEASGYVKRAFTLGTEAGQPDAFIFAGAQLMHLNYLRDRLADIIDTFIEAAPIEVTSQLSSWVARQVLHARRPDEARERWADVMATGIDAELEVGVNAGLVLTSWAHLASVFSPDLDVVTDLRRRLEPFAGQLFHQLAPEQPGHHYLGLLAAATEEYESADEHFDAALTLLRKVRAPVMAAITEIAWADSLARRGQRDRASDLANHAREVATRAGATRVERDAREVLGVL